MRNNHKKRNFECCFNYTSKLFLIFFIGFSVNKSYSQNVEVLQKSELKNLPEGKKYAFIEPTTDTSKIEFVATLFAKDKNRKSNIETLYFAIREQANKLGANCYKVKLFKRDTLKSETVLILDSYVASESLLNENTTNHEKNVVLIFGGEREDDKSISFSVNGERKEIKSGTYFKINLKEGEEVKVSKGGFMGASLWLHRENDKQPAFYSLSSFGLADFNQQPSNTISFNTGRINRISNISLGLLLKQLLKQGN